MENEKINAKELYDEIEAICQKYKMKNWALCADSETDYIGIYQKPEKTPDAYQTSINVARLYQSSREQILAYLERLAGRV